MSDKNKKQWKETSGFTEDTEVAQVICNTEDLKEWMKRPASNRNYYLCTDISFLTRSSV